MSENNRLHFMIDYENVREAGLDGAEYLYNTDSLTIFYSGACESISKKSMDYIIKSGCQFEAVRLKKAGKNALDFYIVSMIGELLGSGYTGKIVVVSKDKGYSAMKDYWMGRGISSHAILLKANVKDGILASNENSMRRKLISADTTQLNIAKEYAKYQERESLKKKVETVFAGTEYEEAVERIFELTESEKKPKDLYLGSLKRFGKTDGTKIYRFLKQGIAA